MDAAALNLSVKSDSVVQAANDLDRFAASATKAGAVGAKINIGSQSGSIAKLVAEVQSANSKLAMMVSSLEKLASADRAAAAANDNVANSFGNVDAHVTTYRQHLEAMVTAQKASSSAMVAADAHVIAYTQHMAALARVQQDANAHVIAYRANLAASTPAIGQADAHVLAYRDSLNKVAEGAGAASKAIKFTAQDSLNASRQLADIGVTAASGMSPFLIAIQQGPQLLDILQNKAAMTGQSLGTVFKAAGAAIWAALVPLLPIILPIVAVLALATAGVAALTKQANDTSGLKKYTTEMGYTKEEVKKLNAVTVTWGDTTKAVFQGALASAASALGINTKTMGKTWDTFLDRLVTGTRAALAGVYAAIAGTKAYLGEVEKGGVLGIGKMLIGQGDPDLLKKTYGKAYADGQKALDAITVQARKNALARQTTMAKGFYDAPTAKKDSVKQNPLPGILRDAQLEIDVENARAAAVGRSARAAIEMEQRTKLLNQIQKAGVPITDSLRAKVDALAKSYSDAKVAADSAAAIQGVLDGYQKQSDAINDQLSLVGSYGDALTKARIEAEALAAARNALPKGEVLTSTQATQVLDATKPVVRDQINLDRANRGEKLRKDAEDAAYAMKLEREGLGLTGAAALQYAFVAERLNEAKRTGNAVSAEELAAIRAAGEAYGQQRYAIDQQAQALANAREVAGGFFADWINGAREGANVFKSFADSAINALNRIIDKLLDKTLNGFLDGLFPSKGGLQQASLQTIAANPSIFAKGGTFGTPTRFANGGAFTNTVVNTPTLFRFANGGALGEMGEAGPEAIVPLKRGPNGSLGVQMHGGGRPAVRMGDIHNTYQVSGAIDQGQIVAMIRQGGAATYDQVKRDLQSLLQQLDTDGAFAS